MQTDSYDEAMPSSSSATVTPAANATARSERRALADLMVKWGPDAPTTAGDWTAKDLAAHLVIREGRPDAALGIQVGALAGWTARVQSKIAAEPWPRLVEQVRSGPPRWNPMSLTKFDAAANTVEFFVHHEDLRRGGPDWSPRELDAVTTEQLWKALHSVAKLLLRHCPVGVIVRATDGPAAGQDVRLRKGDLDVTLIGPVGECLLSGYGRPTIGLSLQGEPADVQAFTDFPR
jgi:uncharacterized protein (TIGR03085 family)